MVLNYFDDNHFYSELAFITDITQIINNLNLIIQGFNHNIFDIIILLQNFQINLNTLKIAISCNNFPSFPCCYEIHTEFPELDFSKFSIIFEAIENEFTESFEKFSSLKFFVNIYKDPFSIGTLGLPDIYFSELLKISNDSQINNIRKIRKYPLLRDKMLSIFFMFPTTYRCESAFSYMKLIKSKQRSSLKIAEWMNYLEYVYMTMK